MAIPNGRRISVPSPVATASGSAPAMAAQVVIMMGLKRSRQACSIALQRIHSQRAFGIEREVHHHDGVLFDDADQQKNPQKCDQAEFGAGREQRQQCPQSGGGQRREYGQRLTVIFIKHPQYHIDCERSPPAPAGVDC